MRGGVPRSADRLRWMIMIRPDRDFSPDRRRMTRGHRGSLSLRMWSSSISSSMPVYPGAFPRFVHSAQMQVGEGERRATARTALPPGLPICRCTIYPTSPNTGDGDRHQWSAVDDDHLVPNSALTTSLVRRARSPSPLRMTERRRPRPRLSENCTPPRSRRPTARPRRAGRPRPRASRRRGGAASPSRS